MDTQKPQTSSQAGAEPGPKRQQMVDAAGRRRPRPVIAALALAVVSGALWWVWFGWDTRRDVDPVTGASIGPYEWWQVCACVLSWAVLAWAGTEVLKPAAVILVMPAAFTASWILSAALTDDSGLWGIGAVLVAVGTLAGNALIVGFLRLLLRRREKPASPRAG